MMVVLALSAGILLLPPLAPAAKSEAAVRALAATRAAAVDISQSDSGGGSAAAAPRQLFFTQGTAPPPAHPVAAQPAAPPLVEMPGLQLYGVVIVEPGSRLAFIQDGSRRGQMRKVREGQTVAGALVKAIYPDRVILISSRGEVSLMLRAKKDGLPTGMASSPVDVPGSPVGPSGSPAAGDGEADDRSPQPLNSSDLSIPLITRQPLYPQ